MYGINGLYFLPFLILHDAFSTVWHFISRLFGKSRERLQSTAVDKTSLVYLENVYVETRKQQFLRTYERKDPAFFSQTIDKVFYDKTALNQILTDENNSLEKTWKTRILIEYTPRGNVFMHYDPYKQAFAYYSDQTVIPYHVMNAVAMKYVITYLCRDFFIDDAIVPKEHVSRLMPKEEPAKCIPATAEKSPFVKPKTYNSVSNKTDSRVEKVTNRFVHLGKVRNYSVLSKPEVKNANNGFQTALLVSPKLSYEEYKKLRQQTTVI
jgi:hypothetical protein